MDKEIAALWVEGLAAASNDNARGVQVSDGNGDGAAAAACEKTPPISVLLPPGWSPSVKEFDSLQRPEEDEGKEPVTKGQLHFSA
jgi:hypothetical protein